MSAWYMYIINITATPPPASPTPLNPHPSPFFLLLLLTMTVASDVQKTTFVNGLRPPQVSLKDGHLPVSACR